jgi:hypothetical protein
MEMLARLVDRQLGAMEAARESCLAEFELYRKEQLPVPVEVIAAALARMTRGRSDDLQLLGEEIRAHADYEQDRMARLASDRHLAAGITVRQAPASRTDLAETLPGFPYPDQLIGQQPVTAAETGTASAPATPNAVLPAIAADPVAAASDSPHSDTHAVAGDTVQTAPAVTLAPIPEPAAQAARVVATTTATQDSPVPQRARPYLLSFASGRRVPATPTGQPSGDLATAPVPEPAAR